jgi:predicted NAD/FAD-dependent oxidoreductase
MELAVVGAGPAGAAAAHALSGHDVTVFEADAVGGRAHTRHRAGCHYDVGANYLHGGSEQVGALLDRVGGDRVELDGDVWTFDAAGTVSEGRDGGRKWTWPSGIDAFPAALLEAAGARLREERVTALDREGGRWRLRGEEGTLGRYDGVVPTPPAPETAALLAAGDWSQPLCRELVDACRSVPYRSVLSAVLHYPYEREYPFYALVNTDREHEVGWLAREEEKSGHVPDGESLLVVQMAPDWSADRFEAPAGPVTAAASEHAAALLEDGRRREPDWTDLARFRHALPECGVPDRLVERAAGAGLGLAGDWVAGEGRVHLAVETGLAAGERLAECGGIK